MLIAFDLDGTLIDSRRDLADAANAMLVGYGAGALPVDRVAGMVGEGARLLVERACTAAGLLPVPAEALERFLAAYDLRLLNHTRAYEGVHALLERASQQATMSLLTNKPAGATAKILKGLRLESFFHMVVGGDSPLGRKPAPEGLNFLMAKAGAAPAETLLVGDSVIDLDTARRAGSRVCLVRYGFGFSSIEPGRLGDGEHVIDRPLDLVDVIDRMRAAGAAR